MRFTTSLALLGLTLLAGGSALAGEERCAVSELMTATWCGYCPYAEEALLRLEDEYDRNRFLVMAYHVDDEYSNSESDARISYYHISGTPTNAIDGSRLIVGGWDGVYNSYKSQIDSDLATESQVSMRISGSMIDTQVDYAVEVTANSMPDYVTPRLYVALAERGLWDDGAEMRPVVRRIVGQDLGGLAAAGDQVLITGSFTMEEGWNPAEMEVLAFIQDDGNGRRVDQGARMFFTDFDVPVRLVTAAEDSVRTIKTHLTNPNSYPIDMRMQMADMSEEGWMGTFCILEWGICLPDSIDITMPPDSTVTVKLQWIDTGATEKTVTSKFLLKTGENFDTVRGVTYTARSGSVDLGVAELVIDDDTDGGSNGNGDGVPQPGEMIEFTIRAQNGGNLLAYDVSSRMTASETKIYVFEPNSTYGDIAAGATVDGTVGRFAVDETLEPGMVNFYVAFEDGEGHEMIDTLEVEIGAPTGIAGENPTLPMPQVTALFQNQPNPFNPRTTISYDVAGENQPVQLAIYDLSGHEVRRLVDQPQSAGHHSVEWNGYDRQNRPVASGVYLYRLRVGEESHTRRMLLVK